jgi:hypothetical protein
MRGVVFRASGISSNGSAISSFDVDERRAIAAWVKVPVWWGSYSKLQ